MSNAIVQSDVSPIEQALVMGDLSKLTPPQREEYYRRVCDSLGLNYLTGPFAYVTYQGKLQLYALRAATDQLRKINGVSISAPSIQFSDGLVIVTVNATDKTGRMDTDSGAVAIGNAQGEARANAIMKAITKAKRRVTLSICGLGWLDETEVETIPGARIIDRETGEIKQLPPPKLDAASELLDAAPENGKAHADTVKPATLKALNVLGAKLHGAEWDDVRHAMAKVASQGRTESSRELTEDEAVSIGKQLRADEQAMAEPA